MSATVITEGQHRGEFIATEARGNRSRGTATLVAGQNLIAGTILGVITATNKVTQVNPTAADGSQTAVKILYDNVDATAGDTRCVVVERDCEVNASEVFYPAGANAALVASINAQLAAPAVSIFVRAAVPAVLYPA